MSEFKNNYQRRGDVTSLLDSYGYIQVKKSYGPDCFSRLTLLPEEAEKLASQLTKLAKAADSLYGIQDL